MTDTTPVSGYCWAHDHNDCRSHTCECGCHDDDPRRRDAVEQARVVQDTTDTPVCWACPGIAMCDRHCEVAKAAVEQADRSRAWIAADQGSDDVRIWPPNPDGSDMPSNHTHAQIAAALDADAEAHDVHTTTPLNEDNPR